jgi:hypothetical protein
MQIDHGVGSYLDNPDKARSKIDKLYIRWARIQKALTLQHTTTKRLKNRTKNGM